MFRRIVVAVRVLSFGAGRGVRRNVPLVPSVGSVSKMRWIDPLKCPKVWAGFWLFTWLGFGETNVEDEIVLDLKRSILLIQKEEYDKAEQMLHLALRLAQQTMNKSAILYAYDLMANLALLRGQTDKAHKLFVEVMQRLIGNGVPENDIKNIHISLKLAHICHLKGERDKAEIGFEWALKHFQNIDPENLTDDEKRLLAQGKHWYGLLMNDMHEYRKSSELIHECYEIMKNYQDDYLEEIVILLNDMATVHESLEEYDLAQQYLLKATALGHDLPKMNTLGAMHINLGRIYLKKNLYEKARKACGYGIRLGHERNNETVVNEGLKCMREVLSQS